MTGHDRLQCAETLEPLMTTTEQPTADVVIERLVGQRMHAFSNAVSSSYYHRTEKSFGVTLPEWRVLRSAILEPGITQGQIAVAEGLNVMNVSRAVSGLKRKGLLLTRLDPNDRRRSLLTPTELGEELGADLAVRERAMYEHVFSVLSRPEVAVLDELLGRVNAFVATADLPDPPPASRHWIDVLHLAGD